MASRTCLAYRALLPTRCARRGGPASTYRPGSGEHPRLRSIANLEDTVAAALPPSMVNPADLVAVGLGRLNHAPALFGPIEIVGITELSPVWRPLLHALARHVPVRWNAGPRPVPDWARWRGGRDCAG